MADDDFEDDLFADVYADEAPPPTKKPATVPVEEVEVTPVTAQPSTTVVQETPIASYESNDQNTWDETAEQQYEGQDDEGQANSYIPIGIKEDGKMFIGGLNWETTDQSLRDYFTEFGQVSEATVMRDSSGRSRGFGFLTFDDPKVVNTVMVKEHFLDGKIIDPKRAIPREEQERTAKIFVGGVSPEASEEEFTQFFTQFGRVIDATLMMDKQTKRARGFGFVTFEGEEAVDRALAQPLEIRGKFIEVKRAQPRNVLQQQTEEKSFSQKPGATQGQFGQGQFPGGMQAPGGMGGASGLSPAMMAKYWFNMQQYFKQMQSMMANGGGSGMAMPNMGGMQMNPAMMAQMMNMSGQQNNMMMQQQMQQMQQQMQQQMAVQQQGGGGQDGSGNDGYEDQSQSNQAQQGFNGGNINNNGGGQQSWDGMYDDSLQSSNLSNRGGSFSRGGAGGFRGGRTPPTGPSGAPPNAPTGPKNMGRSGGSGGGIGGGGGGGSYRGGGRGGHRGFHPYSR